MPVADKITNRAVHIQTIINFYNSNIQDLYIHSFSNEIWECSQVTLLLKHQMYHLTFAYWSIQKSVNQIYLYPLYINVENIKNQEKLSWKPIKCHSSFFFLKKKIKINTYYVPYSKLITLHKQNWRNPAIIVLSGCQPSSKNINMEWQIIRLR